MYSFSIEDTKSAKGIALCLLLVCHLFMSFPDIGLTVDGVSIAHYLSRISKVCVALFVLMSGYGLNESVKIKKTCLRSFLFKQALKIYSTYWLIWFIFVPPGVLFFDRPFRDVYSQDIWVQFVLNFLGVHYYFGILGYNATWWYVSLIIGFYIIFPFVKGLTNKFGLLFLVLTIPLVFVPIKYCSIIGIFWLIIIYLFTFTLGIYSSQKNLFVHLKMIASTHREIKLLLYLILLSLIIWQRLNGLFQPAFIDSPSIVDGIFAFLIVAAGYDYIFPIRPFGSILAFIGEHSYNIFLFHTFIYYYYFKDFIYSFKHPICIFLILFSLCLIGSIFIEKLKVFVGINRLSKWAANQRFNGRISI